MASTRRIIPYIYATIILCYFFNLFATLDMLMAPSQEVKLPSPLNHEEVFAKRQNLTSPPRDHPFAGARDADGNWGYVADPYSLQNSMLLRYRHDSGHAVASIKDMIMNNYMPMSTSETQQVCQVPPKLGIEDEIGWDILVNKVLVGGPLPLPKSPEDPREPPQGWWHGIPPETDEPYFNTPNPPRIFCGMYNYHKKQYLLNAAAETWAFRCDGFLAFSDVTDPSLGAVDLPHYGEETYSNMWQKVRSIWSYIYTNYHDSFDYFHLLGDDTYVIVENLRNYLWSIDDENGTKPLYIGGAFKTHGINACWGGPGYTLNKVALKWLVTEGFKSDDTTVDSGEDRLIGFTLRPYARCYDTHDANGAMRYLGWSPSHYKNCEEEGVRCLPYMKNMFEFWQNYVNKTVTGINMVSSQAVSFHYLRNQFMVKRVHAILYRACPKMTVLANAFGDLDFIKHTPL